LLRLHQSGNLSERARRQVEHTDLICNQVVQESQEQFRAALGHENPNGSKREVGSGAKRSGYGAQQMSDIGASRSVQQQLEPEVRIKKKLHQLGFFSSNAAHSRIAVCCASRPERSGQSFNPPTQSNFHPVGEPELPARLPAASDSANRVSCSISSSLNCFRADSKRAVMDYLNAIVARGAARSVSRPTIARELAVLVDLYAVDSDRSAVAEIDHHVPVQARLVGIAGFGISGAEGEMNRAADFFVEQRVPG